MHAVWRQLAALGTVLATGLALAAAEPPTAPATPTQVYVTVQPDGASVTCDGRQVDAPPVVISGIGPGKHLIVVNKLGYQEERRTIEAVPDQRLNVELQLRPIHGLLLIHSKPDGATVEIDGAYRGETPLLVSDLPLGKYRAKLTHAGCQTKEIDLTVDRRAPKRFYVELTSDSATLVIASKPEGASVTVNGISRGKTPCTVGQVPEGDAAVELSIEGYQPHKQTVRLVAGQEQKIEAVLAAVPASLTVVSIPEKARIYVNNQFRGVAPLKLESLEPGEYRLRTELDGCEPQARTITLGLGQVLVEEFRLEGNTGLMEITTEPANVSVFVDGKEVGATADKPEQTDRVSEPLRVERLAEGSHDVQLTRKGYFSENFTIAIERAKSVSIHKKLNKRFIPNCEVQTKTAVYRGVLLEVSPAGDVKLEVGPGVLRSIPADEIRARRPLREEPEEP
jgi:hypothetical protein